MTKQLSFLFALVLLLGLSSCGVNTAIVANLNSNTTNVELSEKNFTVVKKVTGSSTATYIFWIGGISNKALLQMAYTDMLDNADLVGKSRAIVNVTNESHVKSITPLYIRRTTFVHAHVVEFTD
ncbi:MAG: DUF6567 family protein [Nitritalea sp.]